MGFWNRKKEIEDMELCLGVSVDKDICDVKENRTITLLFKGLIIFMISFGSVGCYLTAMNCDFNFVILLLSVLVTAIACAFLYYNKLIENIGYIVMFIIFLACATTWREYVNSGFYAVVNDTLNTASIYLNLDGIMQYQEKIGDRKLAITVAVAFIGFVMNVLLNVCISRKMNYVFAAVISLPVLLIPLYFEKEPDTLYSFLLLSGLLTCYVLRGGRHFNTKKANGVFELTKKRELKYIFDRKNFGQVMIVCAAFTIVIVSIVNVIFPKDKYDYKLTDSKLKKQSLETTANLFSIGLFGLFNYYSGNGGLNNGQLGGVASIRLDYETDITVKFAPYSYDTLYIKNFVGKRYFPYTNKWEGVGGIDPVYTDEDSVKKIVIDNKAEQDALMEQYEKGADYSARARLEVTNVAGDCGEYLPYYAESSGDVLVFGQTHEFTYYPAIDGNSYEVQNDYTSKQYLNIPAENYETIKTFCEEAGFGGSTEEIISEVVNYYIENIPYTIRPGATPRRQDFINYFLTKNKKGYCAHFASAATLIFRYYGIPARYVEGYAISYNELEDAELTDDEYADYYSGYSELGETAVLSVDATDADAHAWVEVYIEGRGWCVCDVTPPSDEEDTQDFWDIFSKMMNSGNTASTETTGTENAVMTEARWAIMKSITYAIIAILCFIVLILFVRRLLPDIMYFVKIKKANINDRLILSYQRYLRRLEKKHQNLKKCSNYESQLEYLMENDLIEVDSDEKTRLLDILNRAGFSDKMIETDEEQFVNNKIINKK